MSSEFAVEYYEKINDEERPQAERLAVFLIERYDPESVVDLGCATGLYLRPFLEAGCVVEGLDRSPSTKAPEVLQIPEESITSGLLKDGVEGRFDLALCLEVMEHIPEEEADVSLDGLCDVSSVIIFSAAMPGQGGEGHVNCQPREYWELKFRERGFIRDVWDEDWLRHRMLAGYHLGWFPQNLQIFRELA